MDFESLISTALGGALAVAGGVFTHWYTSRSEAMNAQRAVAGAFAGEVGAICAIVRRRRYLEVMDQWLAAIRAGSAGKFVVPVTQDYLTIYSANSQAIGSLPPGLALRTVQFYTQIKSMLEDIGPDGYVPNGPKEAEWHLGQLIELLRDTMKLGEQLVEDLRRLAG